MMFLLFISVLVAAAIGAPTEHSRNVVHEKRYSQPGLVRGDRVDGSSITSFRIALKQRLENAEEYLMSVSHPSSPRYGKLWTAEDVHYTFGPSEDSIEAVRSWLASVGIDHVEESRGWLAFDTTIAHAESMMQSEYYEHEDVESGAVRLGCDSYELPDHISKHVDYITPGIALSVPLAKTSVSREWDAPSVEHLLSHWPEDDQEDPSSPHPEPHNKRSGTKSLPPELQHCGKKITPDCIRALYGIPSAEEVAKHYDSDPINSVGVFEQDYAYTPKDLDRFFKKFAPNVPAGTRPTFDSIDGGTLSLPNKTFKVFASEANIDLDMIYSLTYPQTVVLYQVESFERERGYGFSTAIGDLLDAIDGSFCTKKDKSEGRDCGIYSPTRVTSISYGAPEVLYTAAQQQRLCHEFLKLGLQGHTFTIASGDYGVASAPSFKYLTNGCIIPGNYKATTKYEGPTLNGTVFNPSFPQNCPYVLSVGGTQLKADQTVLDPEVVLKPHLPVYTKINITFPPFTFCSSGGFSNYFSRPSYQKSAVDSYFASHNPSYPHYTLSGKDYSDPFPNIGANGGLYNRAGRGFPDVSANGANFQYYIIGHLTRQWGTSLSTPLWASVITLINEKRAEHGKGPVGFINPVLYEHPEVFNDITSGHNPGCGTPGFDAVKGWDPVTGLGTPNYPKLLELFLSLP